MASTSIQRSRTAGTTKTKFTISMWVKRADNAAKYLLVNYTDDANRALFQFGGSDELLFQQRVSNSLQVSLQTNRKFRDPNGWYAITLTGDSTLAASADRLKLFVNGVRETSFATDTQLSQDSNYYINEATTNGFRIGEKGDGSDYFNGLMSHVHFCDGYAYEASAFGSTDSVTGEWQINTSPSVSYGTNGFFLKMEDSSNMDLDSSSNALTFTTNGTLTPTVDNPSNVLCTLNPLDRGDLTNNATLSNGNTYYDSDQGGYNMRLGTIGANKGKFYWEGKYISHNMHGNSDNFGLNMGFTGDLMPIGTTTSYVGKTTNSYQFTDAGNMYNNDSTTTYASGATACNQINDIGGIALDLDNNKAYFHVNGTWWNSANPSSGTGGLSINAASTTETGFYHPAISDKSSARSYVYAFNFGNGYFGTTAISSEGTNASGIGKFEYDVPSGFTALSTKGLNE